MSRAPFRFFFAALLLLALVFVCHAQDQTDAPDPRVKAALEKLELKFDTTKNGNYTLVLPVKGDRTQMVGINSTTETYGKSEIREIWSIAFKSSGPLSSQVANKLLEENATLKLGAWSLDKNEDMTRLLIFTVKIDADSNSKALQDAVDLAAQVADEKELELTKKDEF